MTLKIALATTLDMALDPGLVGGFILALDYDQDSGEIDGAYLDCGGTHWSIPTSQAWAMLGASSIEQRGKVRDYLDAVAEDLRMWEAAS